MDTDKKTILTCVLLALLILDMVECRGGGGGGRGGGGGGRGGGRSGGRGSGRTGRGGSGAGGIGGSGGGNASGFWWWGIVIVVGVCSIGVFLFFCYYAKCIRTQNQRKNKPIRSPVDHAQMHKVVVHKPILRPQQNMKVSAIYGTSKGQDRQSQTAHKYLPPV
ncbi:chorion class A protein L11-like [Mercenaria mercenaria]|uniref:chorion class A protein L11-like n=1 Tax=Mercenaria mercenaria TaxID=6596 RepID=UPI00234F2AD0|nr:chorion class A protein L11-like [Mercenaria mercenaria]